MSESVIADFVAGFNASTVDRGEPKKGRVVLSQKRLVLATKASDGGKVTIPLSNIFDVAVGHVPEDLGKFFKSTVTIAYKQGNQRHVAAVEADDEKITKFSTVLFKALLNGTPMTVKHPARVGGRVTGEEFRPARLSLKPKAVALKTDGSSFEIDLSTVTDVEQTQREIRGATRQTLSIRHMGNGQATTTLLATDSNREMSLLGRYLRLEYSDIVEDLDDVELTEDKTELLVAVYSTGDGVSLANVLDAEPSQVTMLLNDLEADGLITTGEGGTDLTPKGRIVVSDRLEDVNA
ncbi:CheF family chemotaxis protein [Halorientalis marina]|jgi:helix-turn-helix protein|uniref:CheF family chemotaxis protein n=1 Tax=Halorientalis marina TaxID=2931976 RepID=UPI001FF64FA7|nr:CheF family chemotaxis protein [Halorientalis marina]